MPEPPVDSTSRAAAPGHLLSGTAALPVPHGACGGSSYAWARASSRRRLVFSAARRSFIALRACTPGAPAALAEGTGAPLVLAAGPAHACVIHGRHQVFSSWSERSCTSDLGCPGLAWCNFQAVSVSQASDLAIYYTRIRAENQPTFAMLLQFLIVCYVAAAMYPCISVQAVATRMTT